MLVEKMHAPKKYVFPKISSGYKQKIMFGRFAFLGCLVIALSICRIGIDAKQIEQTCRVPGFSCEIKGDIRIQGNKSTIFVVSPQHTSLAAGNRSWSMLPYPRKGNILAIASVRKWTVKFVESGENIPCCTQKYASPAILFSLGGFSWNLFHDFSDIIMPLYAVSRRLNREVHLLGTDYKHKWIAKYQDILGKLSKDGITDIDTEKGTRCYSSILIGLQRHRELQLQTSTYLNGETSMTDFRQLLRTTYSLKRVTAVKFRKGHHQNGRRPRLMIISRHGSRNILNQEGISKMARGLGYDVVLLEANKTSEVSRVAKVVNSCDVLIGVHGAGLTNMVFLPDRAVVIQIVPLGGIDEVAFADFGEAPKGMKQRYLGYKIKLTESSLIHQYSVDDPVITDPLSIHKQGWPKIHALYLAKQNITLDLERFRCTLLKALKLLQH